MKKNDGPSPLYAVDLFSGCGGLSLGLRMSGFTVVAAVEIDRKAQETYQMNHPTVRLYSQDIRKLDPIRIMHDLRMKPGQLDLLAGCPPCQGFSNLRTRKKQASVKDERNNLVADFMRFVAAMMPKTVMLENVPALAKDRRFRRVRRGLNMLGYATVVHVLDAADYSVPQRRKRLIMLASTVHVPAPARKARHRITVRQAFAGLSMRFRTQDKLHNLGENRSKEVRDLIAKIPKNGGSRMDLGLQNQLECHKRIKGFNDVYGRMSWDDVAPTITSGCHNPSKGRFLHPSQNRAITLREAAILQGFPRNYRFNVEHGKESIALMIGNALPPPFIAAHASALKKGLLSVRFR